MEIDQYKESGRTENILGYIRSEKIKFLKLSRYGGHLSLFKTVFLKISIRKTFILLKSNKMESKNQSSWICKN